MGIVAAIATVATTVVAYESYSDAKDARAEQSVAMQKQAETQKEIRSEQTATNVAAASSERRSQIREERVRRSRIMQAASNTGASGSSGEFGALGGLSTGLSSNIGANLGQIQTANRVSALGQTAADFDTQANLSGLAAQEATSLFNLSTSIFSAVGGPDQVRKWLK